MDWLVENIRPTALDRLALGLGTNAFAPGQPALEIGQGPWAACVQYPNGVPYRDEADGILCWKLDR